MTVVTLVGSLVGETGPEGMIGGSAMLKDTFLFLLKSTFDLSFD